MQGALLIGGRSTRMGTPKCLLTREGRSLVQVLGEVLIQITGLPPLLLGHQPAFAAPPEWLVVRDRLSGAGPLSALLGLFDARANQTFLVLACDVYAMEETGLRWLITQAERSDRQVIWPRFRDRDHGEPLVSVYRPGIVPELERAWSTGTRGLIAGVATGFRHQPVIPAHLEPQFRNVNTPDQLVTLRRQWDTRGAR